MPPTLQVQCRVLLWNPIVLAAISWLIEQVSVFGGRKWVSMDWLLILKNQFTVVEFEQPDRLVRELRDQHILMSSSITYTLRVALEVPCLGKSDRAPRSSPGTVGKAQLCLSHAMTGWCHCTNIYWASLGTRHWAQRFIWIISFDLHSNPMK